MVSGLPLGILETWLTADQVKPGLYVVSVQNGLCAIGGFGESFEIVDAAMAADVDGNGVVDLDDFSAIAACLQGPGTPVTPACATSDVDRNNAVDLRDVAIHQRGM